jgi:RHS repeat-associated protein
MVAAVEAILEPKPGGRLHPGGTCDYSTASQCSSNPYLLNSNSPRLFFVGRGTNWQAIETRTNGTAASNVSSQMVWSAAYVNAAVLQDTYSGGVIQPNSRLYYLQDANWNTTAIVGLVNGSWQVTQRYVYSPYGTITVLNADWTTPPSGTQPAVDNLYQGMTLDSVTGLYYARNRNYDPTLGRWINQDPAGYINGANTYQFVMGNPVGYVDPMGLAVVTRPAVKPSPVSTEGPLWEPDAAPTAAGAGSFLDYFNPWTAVAAPLFDTPPAGGDGDTLQAPWPPVYNHQPHTGPQVQPSPIGGGARNTGNCPTANPGGGGNKPPGGKAVAAPGGDLPPWPGNDPTKAPPGTEWRGQPGSTPGNEKGSYYNPNTGGELPS